MRAAFVASALAIASAYPNLNVVQRLQLIPDASTLVTAVVAGNLATALSGKGPFTVFAPDNFAFDHLPAGVLPDLLKNITLLDEVLTYHVVSGNVSSSQLTDGEVVPTLNKDNSLYVNVNKGPNGQTEVRINRDAIVTYANNFATNGVIHFIDRVLIPRKAEMSAGLRAVFERAEARAAVGYPPYDLVARLELIPQFSTLVKAVVAGGLVPTLKGPGPFTLFAPNDFAFDRLPAGVLPALLKNVTLLDEILTYHAVSGNVSSSQLTDGEKVKSIETGIITVNIYNRNGRKDVVLNQRAFVLNADNYVTNGVFHEIDNVIEPPRAWATILAEQKA